MIIPKNLFMRSSPNATSCNSFKLPFFFSFFFNEHYLPPIVYKIINLVIKAAGATFGWFQTWMWFWKKKKKNREKMEKIMPKILLTKKCSRYFIILVVWFVQTNCFCCKFAAYAEIGMIFLFGFHANNLKIKLIYLWDNAHGLEVEILEAMFLICNLKSYINDHVNSLSHGFNNRLIDRHQTICKPYISVEFLFLMKRG